MYTLYVRSHRIFVRQNTKPLRYAGQMNDFKLDFFLNNYIENAYKNLFLCLKIDGYP